MAWQVRPNVSPIAVLTLLECVTEIASALDDFVQIARHDTPSRTLMVVKTRQISLALRKILLDGNGSLLKRCVENPGMHPLKTPIETAKALFKTETFPGQSLVMSFADGSSRNLNIPAFRHTVSIHPLYGITHETEDRSVLASPFDFAAKTVRFSKWMSKKILQVNGMQFDTKSLLHLVAVNEGAHTNERLPMVGAVLPDEDNAARYSAVDGVKFGVFSYMHFFSLFSGLYIVFRVRDILDHLAAANSDPRVSEMCQLIDLYPRNFPNYIYASVSIAANPFFVLGKQGELVGDYSEDILTTMKIPQA